MYTQFINWLYTQFINWLKAFWISFKVARNAQRLIFLLDLVREWGMERELTAAQRSILTTYCNMVNRFLSEHPYLDSNIWPLAQARQLFRRSAALIVIGERIIYGAD